MMKQKFAGLVLLLSTFASGSALASANCTNPVGVWTNQLGSTLKIAGWNPQTGQLEGTYTSPSGTAGDAVALVGWTNSSSAGAGNNVLAIAFSVQWGSYGSITSWTGTCQKGSNGTASITTIWNLVRATSPYSWDHIITNTDTFTPVP